MGEKISFLFSEYTIDGIRRPMTPAQMLGEIAEEGALPPETAAAPVVDESLDFSPSTTRFDPALAQEYLRLFSEGRKAFPLPYAASYTCLKAAEALIEAIWRTGHFRLGDLALRLSGKWDAAPIGNMSALYDGIEAVSDYLDRMGIRLRKVDFSEGPCSISFKVAATPEQPGSKDNDDTPWEMPFQSAHPSIGRKRRCPEQMLPEPADWLIYIPFDSCEYRLGGSLLAESAGATPSSGADIADADYLIDCYEVVRELVEDGVVKAGVSVAEGGLMTALQRFIPGGLRCRADISDIMQAYAEPSPIRILFAEVPGVLIQISDLDYDYVDAELLLQDVAYFPLGHPALQKNAGEASLEIASGQKSGIALILESLLKTPASEGED